jgi:two-component sensor histidine kinase
LPTAFRPGLAVIETKATARGTIVKGPRVACTGLPEIVLKADAMQVLSMVKRRIHELATNGAKYGALSVDALVL